MAHLLYSVTVMFDHVCAQLRVCAATVNAQLVGRKPISMNVLFQTRPAEGANLPFNGQRLPE